MIVSLLLFSMIGCSQGPQPIKLGADACTFCKMTIANQNFGAEVINKKGKAFKFDDTHCLVAFMKAGTVAKDDIAKIYLVNFSEPHNFIEHKEAKFLKSDELHSPMGGNIATFDDEAKLQAVKQKTGGEQVNWDQIVK